VRRSNGISAARADAQPSDWGEIAMDTAKIFWSGRSQAVRLPKNFRFDTNEVRIRRHGEAVILEPIARDWAWPDALIGPLDAEFVRAAAEQPRDRDRSALNFFE